MTINTEDEKIINELKDKWGIDKIEKSKNVSEHLNELRDQWIPEPQRSEISYISIIVPYFNRINYLKELIESAHKYADIPFQLIVHDDASVDGSTPEVFALRDKLSTLIINRGHNIGLAESVNRLVNTATSDYIIFLNCDCAFTTQCFKSIKDIISKPYIGALHIANSYAPELNANDNHFTLTGLESGAALAFRKSVFNEVGGFPKVHSGVSDVAFIFQVLSKGYFNATPYGKRYVSNLSYERMGNKDSSMMMSGYDCSYSKIFNIPQDIYNKECKIREKEFNRNANSLIEVPGSITNMGYWCEYINKLLKTKKSTNPVERIDWEMAKIHGHDKWKAEILKDSEHIK